MTADTERVAGGGLTRRQLLTRGAIAGGLVWAAPVIRTTAAYATTSNGTERPCTNFYFVVIEGSGAVHPGPASLNGKDIPPAIRQWFSDNPSVPAPFPTAARPQLTQAADGGTWAVLLPEVTGPNAAGRQCRMVVGWGAAGKDFAEGYVDPNPPLQGEAGRRLLFPCPGGGHGGGGGGGGGDNGDGDDDNHGGGGDGDGDDDNKGGSGGDHGGSGGDKNGDDGGCKNGHDDGDHDEDDVACDANAVASATGATGNGLRDATSSTTAPAAFSASRIGSDGGGSAPIGSDGSASTSLSADGRPSSSGGGNGGDGNNGGGNGGDQGGKCLSRVYLIYCCPK